jgi:3D (Asp-Asp-Asp) domain-containing protein
LGSKLYIPAAKGIKLPNGQIHDGIFWAHDIGSMIVEKKIDIFTSFGDQSAVFQKNGMPHGKMVKVYIVR